MCGRYQFSVGRSEDLLRIARDVQRRSGEGAQLPLPDGDVRPAQRAPVLVCRGGKVVGELQTWGLPGPNGRLIINARAETVTQKSLFRRSIAARRCVVPATAFYERDAARRAYTFSLPASPLWLAGIYDNVDGEDRFVILTTAPNASVSPIHDRMPLMLTRSDIRPWLTDLAAALALLAATPPLLERQAQDGQMGMEELLNSM